MENWQGVINLLAIRRYEKALSFPFGSSVKRSGIFDLKMSVVEAVWADEDLNDDQRNFLLNAYHMAKSSGGLL